MRTRTHVIQIVVVSTALVVAISLAGIDVSAIRYFRSDTIVRDAWDPSSIPSPPYFDPAPWAIWSSSDLFVHDVLRAGALPLWDRLQGGGYSPVVVVQNGVFHPLRWAVALVPRDQALSTLVLLIIAFSFLGMWLVLRCGYDTSVAAAYTGAVFYTLSGAFLSFLHFSGASIPLLHLPWLAFALICAQRSRKLTGGVILAAGMALLFLSGHPLLIIAVLVALSGVACGEAWDAGSSRPLALLFVCGAAGALLAAFAILPPLAALDDLWSYKTGSHFGSVYAPFYPWSEWFRAVGAIVADPGRQYFDDTRFAVSAGAG
ncbi:MAG TPA: hypothetical protein VNL91_04875, partial [Thermoanaerobaculia bacterium]|nr:hypothetical protein [Thermoanaerobaculia bacterium]